MKSFIKLGLMEAGKLKTKADVLTKLSSLDIKVKEYTHAPAFTIEDLRKDPGTLSNSPFVKNLVYADKKKQLYFIVAHENTTVGKNVWKALGTTKNNVRLVNEDILKEALETYKGAVNIFALANDAKKAVKEIVFDKELENLEHLAFHPQENTSTVEISKSDLLKFFKSIDREPKFLELIDSEEGEAEKPAEVKKEENKDEKGETKLKIDVKKTENFSEWYSQVITKADLIDYYDISGCYVYKPNSYFMWEQISGFLDAQFKKLGVNNCYFPMFVKEQHLKKEKDHLEGFAAEVAWVTHSGNTKLHEQIAIRPTSETIMYPHFAKWIKSHRDLPLLLNQWSNVVRWEFKHPTPFIRTREFLWQEGHTVHATKDDADKMVFNILDVYANTYENFLAVPVIKGIKSKNEKFAGSLFSSTCETFIPENGRAIQACTSHNLGQNFAKMFEVQYEDEKQTLQFAWQTSWGFTTRSVGIVIMIHSDDKGLVLPPKIAPKQVVLVPIYFKDKNNKALREKCEEIESLLKSKGIRAFTDSGEEHNAGWKFNHWELRGVPLRIELGPKDLEAGELKLVRRFDGEKKQVKIEDIEEIIPKELDRLHADMFSAAKARMDANIVKAEDWASFMDNINKSKIVKTPWCEDITCEEKVKERSAAESKLSASENTMSGSAKTLCIPLNQEEFGEGDSSKSNASCFHCGVKATKLVIWGRSY